MNAATIEVAGRRIGAAETAFLIAELSCNHVGSYRVAEQTVRAIAEAGADAVKLQTDALDGTGSTIDCDNAYFRISGGTLWDGRTLFDLYRETYTPWEWHAPLKQLAESLGLVFFSTPYSPETADFLETLAVPAYKIASSEASDRRLVAHIAAKGKPVILSTGLVDLAELEAAVAACRHAGNHQIALLKCTAAYPATLEAANLRTLPDMAQRFGVVVGLSDHTLGHDIAAAAAALGASIIEKHVILDRKLGGPDAAFSMEPGEFAALVRAVRNTEKALGKVCYDAHKRQSEKEILGRSLFVCKNISKGDYFSTQNIRSIRPGHGLDPNLLPDIVGCRAARDIAFGTPLHWDLSERPRP